jgi:hypothetical protein
MMWLLACTGQTEVIEGNIPPAAVLLVPLDQTDVVEAETLVFSGLVADDRDAVGALALSWSLDGDVGLQGDIVSLQASGLAPGEHTVELSVTDTDGALTVATSRFTVVARELLDRDGDGYGDAALGGLDCDDGDDAIHPEATELCNGLDDDCDGAVDQDLEQAWYPDSDGDGYGDEAWGVQACLPPTEGAVSIGGDCDDNDETVSPGAGELCNGVDDDCNGDIDDDPAGGGWYADDDADGWGDGLRPLSSCDGLAGSLDDSDCRDDRAEQRWCRSCQDLELQGVVSGAGLYALTTAAGDDYDALCDPDDFGGGWTLVATNAWTGTWLPPHVLDDTDFGQPSVSIDFKSLAWSQAPFTDLRFENNGEYAIYEGVGDGTTSWWAFQASVPPLNCGGAWRWSPSQATLAGTGLCSQDLYVNVASNRSTGECSSAGMGWGPTWSVDDEVCRRAAMSTSFLDDPLGLNPWRGSPLRMWVR